MEYLDEINLKDKVIGKTTKSAAHRLGKIHRIAAVLVFFSDQKLLIQKRSDDGTLDHSVGGHVSTGENYLEAAKREAKEELNIEEKLEYLGKVYADETFAGHNIKHMFGIFKCSLPKGWVFKPTSEVKTVIAMEIEEVRKKMISSPEIFSAGFIFVFKEYLRISKLENF